MAEVMVAAGASGLVCWLAAAVLLPRRTRRLSSNPDAVPINPSREEDRVRPAVTSSGERIWLEPDQLVWHEIVTWPELKSATRRNEVRHPA
jgi:hypothetical protein